MSHIYFRYDPDTGVFTVPSDGDGLYFFSTFLTVFTSEYGRFEIMKNNVLSCLAWGDNQSNSGDYEQIPCSAVVSLVSGMYVPKPAVLKKKNGIIGD